MKPTYITRLSGDFNNLPPGTRTYVGGVLYEHIAVPGSEKEAAVSKEAGSANKSKNISKVPQSKSNKAATNSFEKMDIRVGRIVKAWHHDTAEALFCELIDVGEDKPREIASGLRKFYNVEDLKDRSVLVVCNLKPAKLKGFLSHGMVLCASAKDKVEFVAPAEGARVGERIFLEGEDPKNLPEPASASQVTRKKIFQDVAKDLTVDGSGKAVWKGRKLLSSAGDCKANTLTNVSVK